MPRYRMLAQQRLVTYVEADDVEEALEIAMGIPLVDWSAPEGEEDDVLFEVDDVIDDDDDEDEEEI